MLRFERPPDAVFQAILRRSLICVIDDISEILEDSRFDDDRVKKYVYMFPKAIKGLRASLIVKTLKNLLTCLDRPELYYLNDYHYLLIYETLQWYVETHNHSVDELGVTKKKKKELSFIDPFYVEKINFDEVIDLYFFDTDFLMDPKIVFELGSEGRDVMGFNKETFGLSQNMLPHSEELELKIITDEPEYKISPTSDFFGPNSKIYPDYDFFEKKTLS